MTAAHAPSRAGWSLGGALDRLIAPFSPAWAARRARARAAFEMLATYGAAEKSRTTADWPTKQTSADQAIIPDLPGVSARARAAARDDWAAASIIQGYRRHIVGTGITVRSRARDEQGEPIKAFNERADALWRHWCRTKALCDFEQRKTFAEMQGMVVSEFITVGEGIVVRISDSRRNRNGLSPLMLHVIEPEMLAWEIVYSPTRPGNEVRGGIEIDQETGRAVGLWVYRTHHRLEHVRRPAPEFIPYEQVCHIFRQDRPHQTHGMTRLAAVLKKLWHLQMYDQYQIVRARFEAAIGMTIEQDPGAPAYGEGFPSVDLPTARADGSFDITIQPGMVNKLPPGYKGKFEVPTTPGGTYAPFMTQQIKEVAAGSGTDHPTLLRDFTQGSFSAQRQAMLERDKETDPLQNLLIDDFIRPVRDEFITMEILAGRLEAPGFFDDPIVALRYLDAGYHRPPKPWIDPVKQASAAEIAIENRLTTRAAVIAENFGEDWRETFDQIDDEERYAADLGLTMPESQERPAARESDEPDPQGADHAGEAIPPRTPAARRRLRAARPLVAASGGG